MTARTWPSSRWFVSVLAVAIGVQFFAGLGAAIYLARNEPLSPPPSGRTAGRPVPAVGSGDGRERATAVNALLTQHSRALLRRDRTGFLAGIDPDSPSFRLRQGLMFDNIRQVPIADWSYSVDASSDLDRSNPRLGRYRAPVWAPRTYISYRIAGFDVLPIQQRQALTFVERSGLWYIGADDDFDAAGPKTARELWDFGPVVLTRTSSTIVLGHPRSLARLRSLAQTSDQAIPRVTAVWGTHWGRKVVVLVPDSQAELSRIITEGSDLSQIAAVATGELSGNGGSPAGERIIVNPPNFDKLGPLGRRVVLQHEITHVASRAATTNSTATWLAEGFADYVGYLGAGVSVRSAARELAVDVRRGRAPTALPTDAQFDGTNPKLAQVYEMAWLACRLIARTVGQRGLVRFYTSVGSRKGTAADAFDAVSRDQLKLSTAQFTQRWRDYLQEQLA